MCPLPECNLGAFGLQANALCPEQNWLGLNLLLVAEETSVPRKDKGQMKNNVLEVEVSHTKVYNKR